MKFDNLLELIITFGLANRLKERNKNSGAYPLVAAGDPALVMPIERRAGRLPDEFNADGKHFRLQDFDEIYQVSGCSMLPKNIYNGNLLLAVNVRPSDAIVSGDFLIFKVDKEYYRRNAPHQALFDLKLRRALMSFGTDVNIESLIQALRETHVEIELQENQDKLKAKFNKAKDFYPDKELVVSTTYHNGELSYSFHPRETVAAKAIVKVDCSSKMTFHLL